MQGIDEERGQNNVRMQYMENQNVQTAQTVAQVAQSNMNLATDFTQMMGHVHHLEGCMHNLERHVHTLTEEQLGIRQELQQRLEQGLTEPALRYVTERTQHASAELALQAETLLTQLHQGWTQERDHLRDNILQLVQRQQPANLTPEELQAFKESI